MYLVLWYDGVALFRRIFEVLLCFFNSIYLKYVSQTSYNTFIDQFVEINVNLSYDILNIAF